MRWERIAPELNTEIVYLRRTDDTVHLADALDRLGVDGAIQLGMYFSPKDIEYAVGWDLFERAIRHDDVHQGNNLSGELRRSVAARSPSRT